MSREGFQPESLPTGPLDGIRPPQAVKYVQALQVIQELCEMLHVDPKGLPERVRILLHQRDILKARLQEEQ